MKHFFVDLFKSLKEHIVYAFMAVFAFLLPIMPLLGVVLAFIITDTLFGLWKMYKLSEAFSFKKLVGLVPKALAYEGFVALIFLIDKYVISDIALLFLNTPFLATKIISTALCVVEMQSIHRKILEVTKVDVWKRFKAILKEGKEIKKEFTE